MYTNNLFILALLFMFITSGGCQNTSYHMSDNQNNNPLICDPAEGICAMPASGEDNSVKIQVEQKPLKVIYFTDPICSSCWGIEPQLRKLKLEYGNYLEIEYRMGGLLPDWSYNSGGISKPSDVAHHWDEVSLYYDMPIDGDVWLEDPLASSYPPSIAFKAAQLQDHQKALLFLRVMREMVFLQKKNIAKWEVLVQAANKAGLNVDLLKNAYDGKAKDLFQEDLQLARSMGVRGFPTMFFVDATGGRELVYGSKPYAAYESAITKLLPSAIKQSYSKDVNFLFSVYPSLTAKEFSELSGTPRADAEHVLDRLVSEGILQKSSVKNGSLWTKK